MGKGMVNTLGNDGERVWSRDRDVQQTHTLTEKGRFMIPEADRSITTLRSA